MVAIVRRSTGAVVRSAAVAAEDDGVAVPPPASSGSGPEATPMAPAATTSRSPAPAISDPLTA